MSSNNFGGGRPVQEATSRPSQNDRLLQLQEQKRQIEKRTVESSFNSREFNIFAVSDFRRYNFWRGAKKTFSAKSLQIESIHFSIKWSKTILHTKLSSSSPNSFIQ